MAGEDAGRFDAEANAEEERADGYEEDLEDGEAETSELENESKTNSEG